MRKPLAALGRTRPDSSLRKGTSALLGQALFSLGHGRAGEWAEWALPGAVGILGVLQAFGVTRSLGWAFFAVVLLVSERVLARFRRGSALHQFLGRISRINTSFGGTLDSVLAELLRNRSTRLGEATSKRLSVSLLQRLRSYAEVALGVGPDLALRATLAVPLRDEHHSVVALRVWCYDEPYHDRRWSILPIDVEGAPAAFRLGRVRIIQDIGDVPGVEEADLRPYRSIVSIPVRAGGRNGAALAVVSVDAPLPGFFREREIETKLIPMIQPMINTLALVLALKNAREAYEFGS